MSELIGLTGGVIEDVLVRPTLDGYLDVFVRTSAGDFELQHDTAVTVSGVPAGATSGMPREFVGSRVERVLSDDETLLLLLSGDRCIVFSFGILEVDGMREVLRFVQERQAVECLRREAEADEETRVVEV